MDTKRLVAFLLLIAPSSSVSGQMNFWLSATDDVSVGSAVGEVPSIQVPRGGIGQVHVWAQPDAGKTLQNVSLNLVSTSDTAIEFSSAVIVNEGRFGTVFDTNHGLDILDQSICIFPAPLHGIWGLTGLSVDPDSGSGLNAATPGEDPYYDAINETWLLASIEFTAAANATTDLFLEVGQIGMNYEGESADSMSVRLGSLGDAVLGNTFEERCVRSATSEATIEVVDPILGDFNVNGLLDADDMDLLSAEVLAGTHDVYFELTGDPTVDELDRVAWVETLKGTHFGDANLDGIVDFADFLRLSGGFGQSLGWADGDMDGNQLVDFADFLRLSGNFGQGMLFSPPPISVPEPDSNVLLTMAVGGALLLLRSQYR